ncbi:AarF/UbiB family protein [Desulfobacula sp.]|uniref:ABC1 kinase family protein n=1 Tax=Desulfobacula sp. TaxID=2593537 RepID=UPI0026338466|nr:AarF/UbiB family protein [Desulfobacula sp.]
MALFKIGGIGRTYRHIQRYRHIITILFKYGFGDVIDKLKIEQYLEIGWQMVSRKRREKIESLSRAVRVRMALEDLGPTFIKMGQILSTRPDLLPAEFIRELPKLQDEVHPFSLSEIKDIIVKELHKPVEQIFSHFEEQPLAAASIGQVHKARTFDGQDVVVKVQRPGIQSTIQVDLEIMLHLAGLMEKHLEGWDIQQPSKIVEEFAQTLEKELDYSLEAAYMERFARQFEKEPTVHVPSIFHEASTTRVLTMECITGVKISDIEQLEQKSLDRSKIARRGFDLIMKQIFEHGFFHADPHPGNIFVLPDNILCYIDFGMMGRIDLKTREDFADLIMNISQRNEVKTTDALLKLLVSEDAPDYHSLAGDVADFMDQHCYRPLKEVELGKLLNQLLEITARHRLSIPPDLFLMIKALSTVEGIGRALDSDFDVIEQAGPFVRQIQLNRFNPRRIASGMADSGTDLFQLLKEIPGEVREILGMVRKGKVKIEFEHKGLEPMYSANDRMSNRLSFAIVLASLVIGSALIVLSDIPPKWHGMPVIGLAGFLLAGMMGFWLLISIMRRGRL